MQKKLLIGGLSCLMLSILPGNIVALGKSVNRNVQQELTLAQITEIALAKTEGGQVIWSELDYEDGVKCYDIEIIKDRVEYELEINIYTGEILDFDIDY